MTDDKYISAKKLKAHYAWWGETEQRKTFDAIVDVQPAADVQEVIRCKDCVYWKDRHIVQNDGVQRQYKTNEGYVPLSVGFNVGSTCGLEDEDKRVFRNENDFCSRGVKRPTSYEKWWGIVDGFYPSDYDAEMFETEGEK